MTPERDEQRRGHVARLATLAREFLPGGALYDRAIEPSMTGIARAAFAPPQSLRRMAGSASGRTTASLTYG